MMGMESVTMKRSKKLNNRLILKPHWKLNRKENSNNMYIILWKMLFTVNTWKL